MLGRGAEGCCHQSHQQLQLPAAPLPPPPAGGMQTRLAGCSAAHQRHAVLFAFLSSLNGIEARVEFGKLRLAVALLVHKLEQAVAALAAGLLLLRLLLARVGLLRCQRCGRPLLLLCATRHL